MYHSLVTEPQLFMHAILRAPSGALSGFKNVSVPKKMKKIEMQPHYEPLNMNVTFRGKCRRFMVLHPMVKRCIVFSVIEIKGNLLAINFILRV